MEKIKILSELIANANRIVVFTGAGISVPSGIPDFRSANGIFNQKLKQTYTPEEIVSHSFFIKHLEDFYEFYYDKMVYLDAKPNIAHHYFAKLEQNCKKITIVTQNIDGFHSIAGNKNVCELHGSIHRNYCMNCNKFYKIEEIYGNKNPRCSCGGIIKPDVVLYEENLNEDNIEKAVSSIYNSELLIIIGTSLKVYPAASFIRYYRGKNIVLINKGEINVDTNANLVFNEDVAKVIEKLQIYESNKNNL